MLCVDAVPLLGNLESGDAQIGFSVVDNQTIYGRVIENIHGEAVLVAIADDQLTGGVLRDHEVDAELVEFGRLAGDAVLQRL
jgi:hypothetical protein